MAKKSGSWETLVRGVSQQVPEQRLPGQHGEQINVLPDPVRGLVRRQGSQRLANNTVGSDSGQVDDFANNFWEADIKIEAINYTLLARRVGTSGPAPGLSLLHRGDSLDGKSTAVNVSAAARPLLNAGLHAQTVAGQYLILAHSQPVVSSESPRYESNQNKSTAYISVRGGSYARRYTVRLKVVGQPEKVVEYTTPTSSFQGGLDTSDIAYSDPNYTKLVNDRVNAYNREVTAWIGTSAIAITPQAIAQSLGNLMVADGWAAYLGGAVGLFGAVIVLKSAVDGRIEYLKVDDAGAGEQLKGYWQEVSDPSELPAYASVGQVARVAPQGRDAYYLVAEGIGGGYVVVTWKEGPATISNLSSPFLLGVVHAGALYIGSSPANLQASLPPGSGITVPRIDQRKAGDPDSSPMPHFAGKVVTFLSMFQDRLVVGANNVINASRIGDYFNFWRASALTTPDDDSVEVFANGSEDDIIRHGVFFDRSLVLFGDRQQYAISGKVPLTPSTANIAQSSAHKDAARVRPLAHGDTMFYSKSDGARTALYQIDIGGTEDTSNATEVSQQLDNYLLGAGMAMSAVSMPDTIVLRTANSPHKFYAFRYLDGRDGARLVDAWSTFQFHPQCGKIVAFSVWQDRLRVVFAVVEGGLVKLIVDELSMVPGDQQFPYLDSQLAHGAVTSTYGSAAHVAWGANPIPTRAWQGREDKQADILLDELGEDNYLRVGYPFYSGVELTSPCPRDGKDLAITTGRMTITKLLFTHANSGGYNVDVNSDYKQYRSLSFRGLSVNAADSVVGEVRLQNGSASAFVGRDWREYTATISSDRWLPFTITGITWVGQLFNRTPRV